MTCVRLPIIFVTLCLGFACCNELDLRTIDSIELEQPCATAGGTCTIAADCPAGHLSEQRGLCPAQSSQGVECCYGVSNKETRCARLGGVCISQGKTYCNPQLIFEGASDCPDDSQCCVMV